MSFIPFTSYTENFQFAIIILMNSDETREKNDTWKYQILCDSKMENKAHDTLIESTLWIFAQWKKNVFMWLEFFVAILFKSSDVRIPFLPVVQHIENR